MIKAQDKRYQANLECVIMNVTSRLKQGVCFINKCEQVSEGLGDEKKRQKTMDTESVCFEPVGFAVRLTSYWISRNAPS